MLDCVHVLLPYLCFKKNNYCQISPCFWPNGCDILSLNPWNTLFSQHLQLHIASTCVRLDIFYLCIYLDSSESGSETIATSLPKSKSNRGRKPGSKGLSASKLRRSIEDGQEKDEEKLEGQNGCLSCQICKRRFSQPYKLKVHQRIHTGMNISCKHFQVIFC